MITQIAEHFGYHTIFLEETPVAGKTKIDMSALIQQSMISITHDYYSVMIHKKFIIALHTLDRVSNADCANLLYVSVDPDAEDGYDAENVVACESINAYEQHQDPFLPPPQEPNQQGIGSSSMNHD